jgi:hypothetical protein
LVATWGLIYLVSLFALGPWLGYRHWAISATGFIVVPLLFWGNARTSQEYLEEYSVTVGTVSQTVVTFDLPGVGLVSNVNPLAPETVNAWAKIITGFLYSGPRVVAYAWRLFQKSRRFRHFDIEGCAAVLTLLSMARSRVSFQEIVDGIEGLNPVEVFPQMQEIEGVLFLKSDPPGLSLSQELRQTLAAG